MAFALAPLIESGSIPKEALHPPIGAVSVGIVQGQPILNLDYSKDSQAEVDLNVVMISDGRFIENQGTTEKEPFPSENLEKMLNLARKGIQEIIMQQSALINNKQQ